MKKSIVFLFVVVLLFQSVLATNIEVQKKEPKGIYIPEVNNEIKFNLEITNNGKDNSFEFYNFLNFQFLNAEKIEISPNETKQVELKAITPKNFDETGAYSFEYYIKGYETRESVKDTLTFKIINLKDFFEITSSKINPESESAIINIRNKEGISFENLKVELDSRFFDVQENISLFPYETKQIRAELNREKSRDLTAGFYTIDSEITYKGKTTNVEGTIEFSEKNILDTKEENNGFIINTKRIIKENNGNIVSDTAITIEKNIISRLFTTISPEPDIVERENFNVIYTWYKQVKPGEDFEVVVKTNWLFPFLFILFLIAVVILAKQYAKTDLELKKNLSFVKAKGGEFALKITIIVSAKEFVEKVNIIDKLPPLVKLYEKFGKEEPTRMDQKKKKIEWNFDKLEAGEKRIISYYVYSKVGVLGKFALPATTAIYEKDGKIRETQSNRAFFLADQKPEKQEE